MSNVDVQYIPTDILMMARCTTKIGQLTYMDAQRRANVYWYADVQVRI